jgi:hypothetical protein
MEGIRRQESRKSMMAWKCTCAIGHSERYPDLLIHETVASTALYPFNL